MPSGRSWAVNAANAISWMGMALAGVPRTAASRRRTRGRPRRTPAVGGDGLGLGDDLVGGHRHRHAAHRQRAAAVGVEAERADGRVRVQHLDAVGIDAQRSATICDHVVSWPWPCGVEPLTTWTMPVGSIRTVAASQPPAPKLSEAEHPAGRQAAHLDVGGDADAEVLGLPRVPPALLLGPQVVVADQLQRPVQRGRVVARVVGQARDRLRRGTCRARCSCAAGSPRRVDPHLAGQGVHGPLQGVGGLGPPRAPVGVGGRAVGEHAGALEVVGGARRRRRGRGRRRAAGCRASPAGGRRPCRR